ncbi:SMI1/KNR4 family protein [Massilia sp. Leaf139]|uniref:SMI1/KNR4 family protein n=1 Tax=Massilia sp. Leaf139 TaxID=1736272 RepID=UPI0006FDE32E|nr:SMI1/KNR4 family protein [Massilia sp. Leaf139]KQQ96182.1 hypothetical protein ASF77_22020 [Massilia sp. Leaf139]
MALVTDELQKLINRHSDIVDFGTVDDAVDEEWILSAESALGRRLPDSYKWFLRQYAGGEVGGEEIYSIYGMPFESVNGGDIVFQHLMNRKSGVLDDAKLVVSETDSGETYFFDYDDFQQGECPIKLRLPSGEAVPYASDFFEFLTKRIAAHS